MHHGVPEESGSRVKCLVAVKLGYSLIAYNLRHLSVGVLVIKVVDTGRHAVEQPMVSETLGARALCFGCRLQELR